MVGENVCFIPFSELTFIPSFQGSGGYVFTYESENLCYAYFYSKNYKYQASIHQLLVMAGTDAH